MTNNKKRLLLSLSTLMLFAAAGCSSSSKSSEASETVKDSIRTVEVALVEAQPLQLVEEFTAQL